MSLTKIIILLSLFVVYWDIFFYLVWFFWVRKPKTKPLNPEELPFNLHITRANKKPNPEDFAFSPLELTGTEVSIEQIRKNLKAPTDWSIKSIIIHNPDNEFSVDIIFQKQGYEEYVLKNCEIIPLRDEGRMPVGDFVGGFDDMMKNVENE